MAFGHFETFLFVRKRLLSMQCLILELFTTLSGSLQWGESTMNQWGTRPLVSAER